MTQKAKNGQNLEPVDSSFDGFEAEQTETHTHIRITQRKQRMLSSQVRFFPELAIETGGNIRLAALVYHVAGWITAKRNRNSKRLEEFDPCKKFGQAIGVSAKQIYRLLAQAKKLKILDYRRSFRATTVWFINDEWSYADRNLCMCYDKALAHIFGINGSLLLAKIAYHQLNPEEGRLTGMYARYSHFSIRFPWLTESAARCALDRLKHKHHTLDWSEEDCSPGSRRYWIPRLKTPINEQESVIDVLRRTVNLKADLTRPVGRAHLNPERGHGRCSPRSVEAAGRRGYSRAAMSDAVDL